MINLIKKVKNLMINNKSFSYNRSLNFSNNKIIVDGVDISSEFGNAKSFIINVVGDVEKLQTGNGDITITGDVNTVESKSGDIEITGNVKNNVSSSSGDINIKSDVGGNIKTSSGDVSCNHVNGSINTISGDVQNKK